MRTFGHTLVLVAALILAVPAMAQQPELADDSWADGGYEEPMAAALLRALEVMEYRPPACVPEPAGSQGPQGDQGPEGDYVICLTGIFP